MPEILCEVDESGDGLVSFEEFQELVRMISKPQPKEQVKGRDCKELSAETEAAREEAAARSAEDALFFFVLWCQEAPPP